MRGANRSIPRTEQLADVMDRADRASHQRQGLKGVAQAPNGSRFKKVIIEVEEGARIGHSRRSRPSLVTGAAGWWATAAGRDGAAGWATAAGLGAAGWATTAGLGAACSAIIGDVRSHATTCVGVHAAGPASPSGPPTSSSRRSTHCTSERSAPPLAAGWESSGDGVASHGAGRNFEADSRCARVSARLGTLPERPERGMPRHERERDFGDERLAFLVRGVEAMDPGRRGRQPQAHVRDAALHVGPAVPAQLVRGVALHPAAHHARV